MSSSQIEAAEERLAGLAAAEGLGYDRAGAAGNTFAFHRLTHSAASQGNRQQLLDVAYAFTQALGQAWTEHEKNSA